MSRLSFRFNIAAADPVHGGQPAAAAGHHHPAVPAVPADPPAALPQQQRPALQLVRRASSSSTSSFQLGFCVFVLSNYMKTIPSEIDEAALVDGASLWMRYWRLDPAAVPAGAGGAGHAADHLDLQRLLLGDHPDLDRQQAADHLGAGQPAGPVRDQPEHDRGGRADGGDPDAGRLRRCCRSSSSPAWPWARPRAELAYLPRCGVGSSPRASPFHDQEGVVATRAATTPS